MSRGTSTMPTDSPCQFVCENRDRLASTRVVAAGGANVEHGYTLPGDFEADAKYTIEPQPRLAGGSSVNHACRLLAMGVDVHPILPLAKADPLSEVVTRALEAAEGVGDASYRRTDLEVRGADLSTPFTTIIRQGASRAVLNEFSAELMRAYADHVDRHLSRMAQSRRRPDVLLVGHIHADRARTKRGEVGFAGAITERLLTDGELAGAARYVNFGSAQFKQGTKRWAGILRDRVDVFQLDIGEVRRFCRDAELPDLSLESILGW